MEQKVQKKRFRIGEKGKSWLMLSLAISFMICIFAPLEAYFANKTEFWFEFAQILPILLMVFAVVFVVLFLVSLLLQKYKWSHYIYGFVFCLMLYFYIQGNYVPRNYGVLNGVDIDWSSYTTYAIVSIVLLLVSLVAWIVVCLKVKEKIYSAGRLVCTILILLQLVTIGTLYIQNNVLDDSQSENVIVTTKDMFNLSKDKNILVFVLDSFDSFVMQDIVNSDEWSEYEELFSNFTYYPDNVGAYPTTKGALPQILTGEWYENDKPYTDYVREAYVDNGIYTALKENNYSIGVYTDTLFLNPQSDMYTNVEEGNYVIADQTLFAHKLYKLVAFNYMPHQLKKFFYTTSADFDALRKTTIEHAGYSKDVQTFYKYFTDEEISLSETENSFRFYHVEGIHVPYTFDKSLNSDSNATYSVYDEATGNFTLLESYFNELKENGIYDNTTIVILADHGYTGLNQNPLFMIKNAGEKHEFAISDKEMSYEYLLEIFISLAEGSVVDERYIDTLGKNNTERRFMYYSWDNSWDKKYLPSIVEYIASGEAKDYTNLLPTGKTYTSEDEGTKYAYSFNDELSFAEEATANAYCLYGFSDNEGTYTWTNRTDAAMLFDISEESGDLVLSMTYTTYTESQRVSVYVNDNKITDYVAKGSEEKSFLIPEEYVTDGEIYLKFEFPDAVSPKSRGESTDIRILALAMKKLTISVADENSYERIDAEETNVYELNTELSFKEENTAGKYIIQGFSSNERDFTWTDGNKAEMLFQIAEVSTDLELAMEYFPYADSQHVIVSVNGNVVEDYVTSGSELKSIIIPAEYVTDGELLLTFDLPDAVSPESRGESIDKRNLALAMKTLKISAVSE